MATFSIRQPQKVFNDRVKFPYGFRKSGDFSIVEADLLAQFGHTLAALERGEITPQGDDEIHFMQFMHGEVDACNSLEKAWRKYVTLSRGKKHFYTLHSSASNQPDYDDDFNTEEFDVA